MMNKGVVYALWAYEAQNSDELSFREGDALTILRRKDEVETDWWWARLGDREGYVPRNLLGVRRRWSPPTAGGGALLLPGVGGAGSDPTPGARLPFSVLPGKRGERGHLLWGRPVGRLEPLDGGCSLVSCSRGLRLRPLQRWPVRPWASLCPLPHAQWAGSCCRPARHLWGPYRQYRYLRRSRVP